jgi:hypothetical protein
MFIADLADRLANRVQISSDALAAYAEAMEYGFGSEVDYGQVSKTYAVVNLSKDAASRYSPAEVVKTERVVISGNPDRRLICTSHVEKQNHTLRMHCRRMNRLTNAFSKKLENFKAAIALHMAYYNLCKTHSAIRATPAMEVGVEKSAVSVLELLEHLASKEYIERLQMVIQNLHGADSTWLESVSVFEQFQGKTVWDGKVELFELQNHPKAKRCYAWSDFDPKQEHLTAVLESPPVKNANDAVRVHIIQQVNQAKKGY